MKPLYIILNILYWICQLHELELILKRESWSPSCLDLTGLPHILVLQIPTQQSVILHTYKPHYWRSTKSVSDFLHSCYILQLIQTSYCTHSTLTVLESIYTSIFKLVTHVHTRVHMNFVWCAHASCALWPGLRLARLIPYPDYHGVALTLSAGLSELGSSAISGARGFLRYCMRNKQKQEGTETSRNP